MKYHLSLVLALSALPLPGFASSGFVACYGVKDRVNYVSYPTQKISDKEGRDWVLKHNFIKLVLNRDYDFWGAHCEEGETKEEAEQRVMERARDARWGWDKLIFPLSRVSVNGEVLDEGNADSTAKPSKTSSSTTNAASGGYLTIKDDGGKKANINKPARTIKSADAPFAPAPKPASPQPSPKPSPKPAPVPVATTPPGAKCPLVPRMVKPVTPAVATRGEAEVKARELVANACGPKGVASVDFADACRANVTQKVNMLDGKITGVTRSTSWMCMPVAICVDAVERCDGPNNAPAAGSKQ